MYSKEALNSFMGDTFLNTTGLKNLQRHEGKKKLPPDDSTEDEIEDGDIGDENGTEEPSNEIDNEVVEAAVDEVKAETAQAVEEIVEAAEVNDAEANAEANDAEANDAEANDDKADAETSDNVTTVDDAVPSEVKTAPEPTKEGTTMKYELKFFENAGDELYDALVNKLGMSTELHQAVIDLATLYPEIRKDVVELSADLDYQPPAYGWKYQAKEDCWSFSGKIFDSKKAAEAVARDLLSAGKEFDELFIRAPYYLDDKGEFAGPVPKGSRDYEIIVKQAEANAEA